MKSANLPDDCRVEDLPGWSDEDVALERAREKCRAEKCEACRLRIPCDDLHIEWCIVNLGYWKED